MAQTNRLFIADSNHNRIVVTSLDGQVIETVGSGLQGDGDGIFSQARFLPSSRSGPRSLASLGAGDDLLYVADTENHQIRVIDFQARAVHTIDVPRLNSPWDLALKTGILIVAMAGPHQIWVIDLLHDQAYPYAGTGEEERRDGPVGEAAFAQPSGLAIDRQHTLRRGRRVEHHSFGRAAARRISVTTWPVATCLTSATRTARAMGCACSIRSASPLHDGRVLIADTYNHKIKMLDPAVREGHDDCGHRAAGTRRRRRRARAVLRARRHFGGWPHRVTLPTPTITPFARSICTRPRCRR